MSAKKINLPRRQLIKLTFIGALAISSAPLIRHLLAAESAVKQTDRFYDLATFLTNRPQLFRGWADAVYTIFNWQDADFGQKLDNLLREKNNKAEIALEDFVAQLPKDSKDTALAIIESFYTGNIGRGAKAVNAAYETALMFEPTADVTIIPTYAVEKPEYWVRNPNTAD